MLIPKARAPRSGLTCALWGECHVWERDMLSTPGPGNTCRLRPQPEPVNQANQGHRTAATRITTQPAQCLGTEVGIQGRDQGQTHERGKGQEPIPCKSKQRRGRERRQGGARGSQRGPGRARRNQQKPRGDKRSHSYQKPTQKSFKLAYFLI